jgi:site-specific recombinase XerC
MARGDNLPLAALQQIEAAALQLLSAVRQAGNGSFSSNTIPLRPARLPTVADLCNAFLLAKARAGRSARYLRLLRTEIYSFAKGRERRAAESVSSAEIESWLHSQHWAARTQRGRLMTVRNLFAWCVTRSELAANPALGVDMPFDDSDTAPPGIHTPDEARAVLIAARDTDLNAMRCLAVRYFAGLRTTEACALEEKEIHEEFIEVTAAKSKTRRRRLVTIQPNLRAWLALGGVLPLRQVNNRLRAVVTAAGQPWPHNVTRHSFVSYHLAKFQNAGKTALEAGHTERMLFAHYRELVTSQAANDFWEIRPE